MTQNIEVLRARISGIKDVLSKHATRDKTDYISQGLADDFNGIRDSVLSLFPQLHGSLPQRIESTNLAAHDLGIADASYLDLEIRSEQMAKLLALAASGRIQD